MVVMTGVNTVVGVVCESDILSARRDLSDRHIRDPRRHLFRLEFRPTPILDPETTWHVLCYYRTLGYDVVTVSQFGEVCPGYTTEGLLRVLNTAKGSNMTIRKDRGGLAVQASRPFSTQNVTIGPTSNASTAFTVAASQPYPNAGGQMFNASQTTLHVRVVSSSNCWLAFGAAPTATMGAGSTYLPANLPEYFFVNAGEKIAVIQDTVAGTLNIAELGS